MPNPDTMTSLLLWSSRHQPLLTPVLSPHSPRLAFPNTDLVTSLANSDNSRASSVPGAQGPHSSAWPEGPPEPASTNFVASSLPPKTHALSPPCAVRLLFFACCFLCLDCHSQLLLSRSFCSLCPSSVKPFPLPTLGSHRIWIQWLITHFSVREYSSLLMSPLKVYKSLHFCVLST